VCSSACYLAGGKLVHENVSMYNDDSIFNNVLGVQVHPLSLVVRDSVGPVVNTIEFHLSAEPLLELCRGQYRTSNSPCSIKYGSGPHRVGSDVLGLDTR